MHVSPLSSVAPDSAPAGSDASTGASPPSAADDEKEAKTGGAGGMGAELCAESNEPNCCERKRRVGSERITAADEEEEEEEDEDEAAATADGSGVKLLVFRPPPNPSPNASNSGSVK
jgi:hypothetical protein